MLAVKIEIQEYERGWGSRVDDYMVCLSVEDALNFKKEFNGKNTDHSAPDLYWVATGEPIAIDLNEVQYLYLVKNKRVWWNSLKHVNRENIISIVTQNKIKTKKVTKNFNLKSLSKKWINKEFELASDECSNCETLENLKLVKKVNSAEITFLVDCNRAGLHHGSIKIENDKISFHLPEIIEWCGIERLLEKRFKEDFSIQKEIQINA